MNTDFWDDRTLLPKLSVPLAGTPETVNWLQAHRQRENWDEVDKYGFSCPLGLEISDDCKDNTQPNKPLKN